MNIAQPDQAREKRRNRLLLATLALLVIAAVTVGLAPLKAAAPTVERAFIRHRFGSTGVGRISRQLLPARRMTKVNPLDSLRYE